MAPELQPNSPLLLLPQLPGSRCRASAVYGCGVVLLGGSHDDLMVSNIWLAMCRTESTCIVRPPIITFCPFPSFPPSKLPMRKREKRMGAGSMHSTNFFVELGTQCIEPGPRLTFNIWNQPRTAHCGCSYHNENNEPEIRERKVQWQLGSHAKHKARSQLMH